MIQTALVLLLRRLTATERRVTQVSYRQFHHSVWILNSEETCQALFMVFFGRITSHLKNNRARSMNGHEGTR